MSKFVNIIREAKWDEARFVGDFNKNEYLVFILFISAIFFLDTIISLLKGKQKNSLYFVYMLTLYTASILLGFFYYCLTMLSIPSGIYPI